MKFNIKLGFEFLFLISVIIGFVFLWPHYESIFSNVELFKNYILGFGIASPIIFILAQAIQVLFAPIPGQVMFFASGYIFGWGFGLIYSTIGLALGSFLAFYIGRRYGRPFVEKVVSKKILEKFDIKANKHGYLTLFLIFLIPGLPDDAVCFVAGLSNLRIRTMVLISIIGRLPSNFVMSMLGDGLFGSNYFATTIVLGLISVISIIMFFEREIIESKILRLIAYFKKKSVISVIDD